VWAVGYTGEIHHLSAALPALPGGQCSRPVPLHCGDSLAGSNRHLAARFDTYPGAARDDSGPEVVYRLESPLHGKGTLTLTPAANGYGADLDLLVLPAAGDGGCDRASPIAASGQRPGQVAETVVLDLEKGAISYVVVDGYAGGVGSYRLALDCSIEP
jgi:hypothetical protein